uniref:Vesicle trafficking 1 n=1 Tax=Ornithorhynchus anatinus TaxID=9258 RepID=A0A6I8NYD0_ORNAN
MAAPSLSPLPPLPPQFKSLQHHLRTGQEHDKREPVVAYYCRLYAMQTGMKLDSKTPECRKFLSKLMDQLEALKKQLGDNEAITQEIVGCAHLETYALKMFLYADNEDRAGRFHKNMIKSFYTASLLIDVLTVFGELSDENVKHRKYARWKATYIHNCLKNGETPQAGPIGMEGEGSDGESEDVGTASLPTQPQPSSSSYDPGSMPSSHFTGIQIPPGAHAPANTPAEVPHNTGDVRLTPEDFARAQKYCKFAGSALQYEDRDFWKVDMSPVAEKNLLYRLSPCSCVYPACASSTQQYTIYSQTVTSDDRWPERL